MLDSSLGMLLTRDQESSHIQTLSGTLSLCKVMPRALVRERAGRDALQENVQTRLIM